MGLFAIAGQVDFRDFPFERFEKIPFAKIGLYADEFRTTVPAYRRALADWTPGRDASRYDVLDRE